MSDTLFTLQDPDDGEAADRLGEFARMQAGSTAPGDAGPMTVLVARLLRADIAIVPQDAGRRCRSIRGRC